MWFRIEELIDLESQGKLVRDETKKEFTSVSKENTFRDVHVYDGKLSNELQTVAAASQELKDHLLERTQPLFPSFESKEMARRILSDNTPDDENGIRPSDLFCDILIRSFTIDLWFLLIEQLEDNIRLGPCPQGRTTRLLQIRQCILSRN